MASSSSQIETPTDDPAPPPKAQRKKPTAANRYQLFDDGKGDYRIYEITKDPNLPKGALVPVPTVPGFGGTYEARKFIAGSGDKLQGKQLMILKGLEICSVDVQTVTKVGVKFKPKKAVTGPASGSGEDGE